MRRLSWLRGLVRRRPVELLAAALSIAIAVAFIASIGTFATANRASLARQAAARVPVDWQVQVTPQANEDSVARILRNTPDVRQMLVVRYAKVTGFQSQSGSGTRATGSGYVVSLPAGYGRAAPTELRYLLGAREGVLLLQQTAANLAASLGSVVTITTGNGVRRTIRVDGVIDLPQADSFFQVVGAPAGAGASAPPDNVLVVDPTRFAQLTRGLLVVTQFHVQFNHAGLPHDPATAASLDTRRINHFSNQVAGAALVGDNLGAALSAAREDALYAQLLLLLLGLPGVVLAALVASLVTALSGERRRRETALLRLRGASSSRLLRLTSQETAVTGLAGVGLGIALALLASRWALPSFSGLSVGWTVTAAVVGIVVAAATQLGPSLRTALGRGGSDIAGAAARIQPTALPGPLRGGSDVVLLLVAGIIFYFTSKNGYQVVVVPEGVPVASVNYAALLAPALAWPGLALLMWRLNILVLGGRTGRLARQGAGRAPEIAAAALRRRRRVIARGAAGLGVAIGLAASTAIFTSTYDQQANLDVALTVGADVAVTQPLSSAVGPSGGLAIASVKGVRSVEPIQHRLAYVGADLQDLYGINPQTIRRVAPLLDSFVPGSTVSAVLRTMQAIPSAALLSAETIKDYQLQVGDQVRLRLQVGPQHAYKRIDFKVVGVIKEFPTAPKDSFIIANASYIAGQTQSDAVGTFLVRSSSPVATADSLRAQAGPGVVVRDIVTDRQSVPSASGLAGTSLTGLSRLQLGFGLIFALACSGLTLALGIAERRRALVLLAALGASARQRGRFLGTEARALVVGGVASGVVISMSMSYLLVKVLNGIFDPPPTGLSVPVTYLVALGIALVAVSSAVLIVFGRLASRAGLTQLRDL
jgi:putative ABC transport system permease protein